jgi:putative transposase
MVNLREKWGGHFWLGRFASCVFDEPYPLTAGRYVEPNPVRAWLIGSPIRYRWCSAADHLRRREDVPVTVRPPNWLVPNWRGCLARAIREEDIQVLRANERTGRPVGDEEFLSSLARGLGRILRRQKPGPKRSR